MDPYHEYILDARDTCSNCLRKNRVERVDAVMSRSGLRHELDAHYSRDRRETTIDYFDGGDEPTRSKTVFCECGVEGAYERLWDPETVSREKFKELLKDAILTLERKDVDLRRKETLLYAISHFDTHGDADRAISNALEAGVLAAVAASDDRDEQDLEV